MSKCAHKFNCGEPMDPGRASLHDPVPCERIMPHAVHWGKCPHYGAERKWRTGARLDLGPAFVMEGVTFDE